MKAIGEMTIHEQAQELDDRLMSDCSFDDEVLTIFPGTDGGERVPVLAILLSALRDQERLKVLVGKYRETGPSRAFFRLLGEVGKDA